MRVAVHAVRRVSRQMEAALTAKPRKLDWSRRNSVFSRRAFSRGSTLYGAGHINVPCVDGPRPMELAACTHQT